MRRLSNTTPFLRRVVIAGAAIGLAVVAVAVPAGASPAGADAVSKPGAMSAPTAAGPPAAAAKDPVPAGFISWSDVYAFQTRLDTAAERILAVGRAENASIVAAPQNHELRVYWKGTVPGRVRNLVKDLGVPVRFASAAYTHTELVAQAKRLIGANPAVAEVAPRPDGSGLNVTVVTGMAPADRVSLRTTTEMPLTITNGPRPESMFNRQADIPGFWGGSAYTTPLGGCTNGFPISTAGSPNNVYMLSAGHCGNNTDPANISGQPVPTGTITAKVPCRDILLIHYPFGTGPEIYVGGTTSSSGASVVGTASDFVGNLVDTGGALTGEHLNITVGAVDVFASINGIASCDTNQTLGPFTQAFYSTASCATAPGDSGGPVYSYLSNSTVLGRGTITAGMSGTGNCGVAGGSNTVLYVPLIRPSGDAVVGSLQFYGVGLLTCPSCTPPGVTVPNVTGQSQNAAMANLTAVGLQSQVSFVADNSCNDLGDVISQSPDGGAQVTQGSTVSLSVGQMPPPPFQCP